MEDCKEPNPPEQPIKKRIRKRRCVKNAYVDIDSVAQPGIDYCAWIPITRQKLKEREQKQSQVTITRIESIVNNYRNQTPNPLTLTPFVVANYVKHHTFRVLFDKIDIWEGVRTTRLKA
eukprot:405901_1